MLSLSLTAPYPLDRSRIMGYNDIWDLMEVILGFTVCVVATPLLLVLDIYRLVREIRVFVTRGRRVPHRMLEGSRPRSSEAHNHTPG